MAKPSLQVRVESTAPELSLRLRRLARQQLPFATARALTDIAQLARDEQRGAMSRRFKIRNQRVVRGITIQRAEKKDWPKTFALVGTRDPFIARHEAGGVQRPTRASPGDGLARFAVPTRVVVGRRTKGGKVPASLRPRRVLRSGAAFLTDEGIVLRRKRRKTLGELGTLFTLHRTIKLKRSLRLAETVTEVAAREYPAAFAKRIRQALESRR